MRNLLKPILCGCTLGLFVILLLESVLNAQGNPPQKPAAMVNGIAITLNDVDLVLRARGPQLAPLTSTQLRQLRLEVLNGLIDETLIQDYLKQNAPKLDPKEVDRSIAALEAAQKAQNKTLADYYRETNQTEAEVREHIATMLGLAALISKQTTPEQMKAYFEANKDHFEKVTARVSHIVLRVSPATPSPEVQQMEKKLRELRAEIVAGKKDFAEAAKELSHCPSAPKGGEIGFIARKWQVDDRFSKAAFALKPGEISDVVQTDFGIHLIKLMEKSPGTPTKFDLIQDEIRDCFAEDWRQATITQLRAKAKIEIMLP